MMKIGFFFFYFTFLGKNHLHITIIENVFVNSDYEPVVQHLPNFKWKSLGGSVGSSYRLEPNDVHNTQPLKESWRHCEEGGEKIWSSLFLNHSN